MLDGSVGRLIMGGDIRGESNNIDGMGRIEATYFRFGDGSAGAPGLQFNNDTNTGFFRASSDRIDTTLGGTVRLQYATGAFAFQETTAISTTEGALTLAPTTNLVLNSINAGVTAAAGSIQDGEPITKMITQISTCATAGDAVTLPSAVAGSIIIIMSPLVYSPRQAM